MLERLYVTMKEVTMPFGMSGSDHIRLTAVELASETWKFSGESSGAIILWFRVTHVSAVKEQFAIKNLLDSSVLAESTTLTFPSPTEVFAVI